MVVIKVLVVFLAVAIIAVNSQNVRINTGYGSRQFMYGGGGYGRTPNVQVNSGYRGYGRGSNVQVGGRGYGGYPGVYVNGRDYTGRNVNEPGLQINQSPYNYQYSYK